MLFSLFWGGLIMGVKLLLEYLKITIFKFIKRDNMLYCEALLITSFLVLYPTGLKGQRSGRAFSKLLISSGLVFENLLDPRFSFKISPSLIRYSIRASSWASFDSS